MFLRQQQDLLVQKTPVIAVFAYRNDSNEDPRSGREVGCLVNVSLSSLGENERKVFYLSGLLLEQKKFLDSSCNVVLIGTD
jgi:hypothetical protein